MQLIGEFMCIRPQRLQNMLYAGQILRQPRNFGSIAENRNGAFDLIVPPQRNAVRNHRDVCDGFQADVVFGFSRAHDASYRRARINHLERLSNRLVNTDAQHV